MQLLDKHVKDLAVQTASIFAAFVLEGYLEGPRTPSLTEKLWQCFLCQQFTQDLPVKRTAKSPISTAFASESDSCFSAHSDACNLSGACCLNQSLLELCILEISHQAGFGLRQQFAVGSIQRCPEVDQRQEIFSYTSVHLAKNQKSCIEGVTACHVKQLRHSSLLSRCFGLCSLCRLLGRLASTCRLRRLVSRPLANRRLLCRQPCSALSRLRLSWLVRCCPLSCLRVLLSSC
mmetsp:Transcript_45103/g.84754  ORF Transcript_45103/g.84754 Transcript_45103/m.84754 type:complete len:233 (-) Transcript_45103:17-715(-)